MAARHFKYTYNSEIPPKVILSRMLTTNIDHYFPHNNQPFKIDLSIENNRRYFNRRKELKNLMKSVNSHIDNNSQTLFLALYYMDIIFTHKELESVFFSHFYTWRSYGSFNDFQMNYYVLLSLACLIVASKFNENDPHVPTISSYIRLLYEYSKKKYIFNLDSLYMAEVVVVKLLKYKLNYYTIYHYLIYFFTHGIVFKRTIEGSEIFKKYSERKILEKIYIQAREILDGIINTEKYFDLYFGKDNYIIVIEILLWSIEHIMSIKLKEEDNIFKLVFNLNVEEKTHKEMYQIIEEIYKNTKKKNNFGNKSTRGIPLNNTTSKTSLNHPKESESEASESLFSSYPQKLEINYRLIQPKSSVPNPTSFTTSKSYYPAYSQSMLTAKEKDKEIQYYNGLIHNELDRFNSNYNYILPPPHHIQHQSITKNDKWAPKSTISYGPNNRIYLTSYKNLNSNYELNTADNNAPKIINIVHDVKTNPFDENEEAEKEPIDNNKNNELNYQNKNCKNIDYDGRKMILINNNEKIRKKSSSCSKNIYNNNILYNNFKSKVRSSTNKNINTNINKIELNDNINKEKIQSGANNSGKSELNNYFFMYSQNDIEQTQQEKDNIFTKYKANNNNHKNNNSTLYLNKSYNPSFINEGQQLQKFNSGDEFMNRAKNVFTFVKNNSNDLEPHDNNRRSSNNKYYIDSGMKANINKSYNNSNTIIINNNIHINTFIDKNNIKRNIDTNLYLNNNSANIKNINGLYNEHILTNRFKNSQNKPKIEGEENIIRNKNNKSSIVFAHRIDK